MRHELAYREVGAAIEPERLWGKLLSSQALDLGLFGPLKQRPALATAALRPLFPDLVGVVTDILFEHSPGRGDPVFTGDRTAFDVLVRCTTPTGRRAFLVIEGSKYTGSAGRLCLRALPAPRRAVARVRPFPRPRQPHTAQRRYRPVLAPAAARARHMLARDLYDEGRVVVVAPAPNRECWQAVRLYADQLAAHSPAEARSEAVALERVVAALAAAGAERAAAQLVERHLDLAPVHTALSASFHAA